MNKFDENGALSRDFLENRGWCCGNECANCCYTPKWTRGSTEVLKYEWSLDGKTWFPPDPQQEYDHKVVIGELYYNYNF